MPNISSDKQTKILDFRGPYVEKRLHGSNFEAFRLAWEALGRKNREKMLALVSKKGVNDGKT